MSRRSRSEQPRDGAEVDRGVARGDQAASVSLLTTGGTIEAVGDGPLDLDGYMFTGLRVAPAELVDGIDVLSLGVALTIEPLQTIPSPDITSRDWLRIRQEVLERLPHRDAIVVTHGTNTLEETALFLALTVPSRIPIVLTGAMRPARSIGSDGQANLVAALRVAATPESADRGVLVVMDDVIHDARRVTKERSDSISAFTSPGHGPVGRVGSDGRVRFHGAPCPPTLIPIPDGLQHLPRVDVVSSHADADGVHIEASVLAGAKGIVLSGTGSGHPTAAQREAMDAARESGVMVCRAARGGRSNADASANFSGWTAAGSLRPWQARIVVAVCLAAGMEVAGCEQVLQGLGT